MRNADGVRNLRKIIDDEQNLFIIVSAMGKTTNALEKVFEGVQKGDKDLSLENVAALREYHAGIINDLWHGPKKLEKVDALFDELERVAVGTVYKPGDAELWYDTIVAFGELVSTTIISEYLNYAGVANRWIDMRRCFLTEQRHKDAGVDLEASEPLLKNALAECVENIFIGQGFIGGAPDGTTTTLGREGSDYSAAVVANILDAESMSVWKDVDGVLNADPKIFPDAEQIAELIAKYHCQGVPVAFHANGDAAIEFVVRGFEEALRKCPRKVPGDMIIHVQMATDEQLSRLHACGVTPTFFVRHVNVWGERHVNLFLGEERAARLDPCGSCVRMGIPFGLHVDSPVQPVDAIRSIHTAVNRTTTAGRILGPDQRISPLDALKAYTVNAAKCSARDHAVGTIAPGYYADFVQLSGNPLTVPPESIETLSVLKTISGGRIVYES